MSYNWHGKGIAFHVFDLQGKGDFEERYRDLVKIKRMLDNLRVCEDVLITPQIMVHSYEELMKYEGDWVEQGYEGVMVRSIHGIYKQGRSTAKDGYLLKLKRFKDDEAICTGVTKLISAYFDKLDQVGALRVYHPTLGNFDIGAGMTTEERIEFWKNPPRGQAIKFKYFGYGEYSKPRYPVFLGVRKDV
jgi:DNA ligase-1